MKPTEMHVPQWLWQQSKWPNFEWQEAKLQPLLRRAYDCLGQLKGRMIAVEGHEAFTLDALLTNIVASSAIESEKIDVYSVRSSLARQLGIEDQNPVRVSEQSEGLASLMRNAVTEWQQPLSLQTLLQWHQWLFQGHDSLLQQVSPGMLRGNAPMQIISGPIHKPKVHFEAPPRAALNSELEQFVQWFNDTATSTTDPLLRAGITHLWFVQTLILAVQGALAKIEKTLFKTKFWGKHADKTLLEPQRKVLNRMLDGDFEQSINATQYLRVAKVSKATATRHLSELVEQDLLEKLPGGGRSTRYALLLP